MRRIIISLLCLLACSSWAEEQVAPLSKDEWKTLSSIMHQLEAKSPDTVWEQYNSNFYDPGKRLVPRGTFKERENNKALIVHFKQWFEKEIRNYTPENLPEDSLITLPNKLQKKSTLEGSLINNFIRLPFCDPDVICFTVVVPFKEGVPIQYLVTSNREHIIDAIALYSGGEICNEKTCARSGIGWLLYRGDPKQKWSPPKDTYFFPTILSEDISAALPREDVQRYYYLSPNGQITLARQECYSIYPIDYLENNGDVMVPSCRNDILQRMKEIKERKLLRKSKDL